MKKLFAILCALALTVSMATAVHADEPEAGEEAHGLIATAAITGLGTQKADSSYDNMRDADVGTAWALSNVYSQELLAQLKFTWETLVTTNRIVIFYQNNRIAKPYDEGGYALQYRDENGDWADVTINDEIHIDVTNVILAVQYPDLFELSEENQAALEKFDFQSAMASAADLSQYYDDDGNLTEEGTQKALQLLGKEVVVIDFDEITTGQIRYDYLAVTESSESNCAQIFEYEFIGTETDTPTPDYGDDPVLPPDPVKKNIAPEGTAFACDRPVYGGNFGPELVNDENESQGWQLDGDYNQNDYTSNGGVWVGIDFGEPRSFDSMELLWEEATRASQGGYYIQTSDDSETWTNVTANIAYEGGLDTITFDAVTARYVRVVITSGSQSKLFPKLWEMRVFEATGETPVTPATFVVSFDANGGENAPADQEKTEGVDLTLTSDEPTFEGYTFLGWATISDAIEVEYAPGGTFAIDADTTLYAVWQEDTIDPPAEVTLGDVDGNGVVDASDLTVLAKHVGGITLITDEALLAAADVDGSGAVDASDLTALARHVGGIELIGG